MSYAGDIAPIEAYARLREAPGATLVLFLCRSEGRSAAAAEVASRAGFRQAYNVAEGFEGPLDTSGHRGTTGGWNAAGLPWNQS